MKEVFLFDSGSDFDTFNSPWQSRERTLWLEMQSVKRSYHEEVVSQLMQLPAHLVLENYGALDYDPQKYPVFLIKSKDWQADKEVILITGGVHGYETSGVHGAIRFAVDVAHDYKEDFNFVIAPCVSPWGYETINRWNPGAVDPNRSFRENSPAQESALLMNAIKKMNLNILAHFDLHETTDTDNTIFRPALASRDGIEQKNWNIPDGFYAVGDSEKPYDGFQKAIIDSVKRVTHIAEADESNQLIGETITQFGVINYATRELGLCAGFTNREYCTTTEVYPDSDRVDGEECILAQVAAVRGGLDYLLAQRFEAH
ncbi:M14 family metallocarboxypeptidase [Aliikangiella sp. G2MR2-5]|uniref:M14 family metallopeptidase n=1 Tax=Aliikangiella sp. G2MR2-5 TaxID=2788943 RepID=UPI0018AB38EA|nr:M14 family metallocarboxypeptidase [Aliikangiella sp. G2MR2-5]